MSYRYIDSNSLVGIVDTETQDKINQMPCIYADIKPNNQHINLDEIRADERAKILSDLWVKAISKFDEMLSLDDLAEIIEQLKEQTNEDTL